MEMGGLEDWTENCMEPAMSWVFSMPVFFMTLIIFEMLITLNMAMRLLIRLMEQYQ